MGKKNQSAEDMNRSTFWMIKYMNRSIFSKARYMNEVGFEILARTPVPKLALSYPHPPPPPRAYTSAGENKLTSNVGDGLLDRTSLPSDGIIGF